MQARASWPVAFLAKAGMWPLNFWLVPAYSSASAPVAAMFAIMTKVGIYTLLRLWTLLFSGQAGASAYFGGDWLIYGGMATIVCAAVAILAAQRLERMASLSILVSAGILLAAIGFGQPNLIAAALFYVVSSTLALSALFLLAELIERSRSANEMPWRMKTRCCLGRSNRCIRSRASTSTTTRKPWSAR